MRRLRDPECVELVMRVTDYLESALPGPVRDRVEAHLAGCPDCEEHLAQLRAQIALTGRLSTDALRPELRACLLAAAREVRNA